jgi:ribosome-binding protein aMBF1 (putative translation factor)
MRQCEGLTNVSTTLYAAMVMARRGLTQKSKNKLAELIKTERERRGWTQDRLAQELNVSINTVEKWEQGATAPSTKAAKLSLKQVLDINIDALMDSGEVELSRG